MKEIHEYHLHKNVFSKIHLEVKELEPYLKKSWEKAIQAHRHSFYQIIWFREKGRHYVDYQVIDHPANTIFFLNRGQIHYFCPNAPNNGIAIHFNEQFLARFGGHDYVADINNLFNEIGDPFIRFERRDLTKFEHLLVQIQEELQEEGPLYAQQSYFLLRALMNLIVRNRETGRSDPINTKDYELAHKFRQLIEQHMDEPHSIGFFSEKLFITEKQLTRITKTEFNDTPASIIQKRKILEAKRRLANRKISIKEIAYGLGFEQPSNFTKYFKKHTGILPKEFQKLLP